MRAIKPNKNLMEPKIWEKSSSYTFSIRFLFSVVVRYKYAQRYPTRREWEKNKNLFECQCGAIRNCKRRSHTLQKPKFNANEKSHTQREASVDGTLLLCVWIWSLVSTSLGFCFVNVTRFEYIGSLCWWLLPVRIMCTEWILYARTTTIYRRCNSSLSYLFGFIEPSRHYCEPLCVNKSYSDMVLIV